MLFRSHVALCEHGRDSIAVMCRLLSIHNPTGRLVLRSLFAFGWALVLLSTFWINHFDLFGLRQVWLYLLGRPYTAIPFANPGPYLLVRHPLYVGWLFAFWMTPTMTLAHLLFSVATTGYILLAIQFEERDLIHYHGRAYKEYRQSVPMLIPFANRYFWKRRTARGIMSPTNEANGHR
jgi:hypothetical protein